MSESVRGKVKKIGLRKVAGAMPEYYFILTVPMKGPTYIDAGHGGFDFLKYAMDNDKIVSVTIPKKSKRKDGWYDLISMELNDLDE